MHPHSHNKVFTLHFVAAFGTELEYADDVTLTRAIEGRQEF